MKKEINVFDANAKVFALAANYIPVELVKFEFKFYKSGEKCIQIWIHLDYNDVKNTPVFIEISDLEIKYGIDLILNRVEKACVAQSIELKTYSPQLLVF